MQLSAAERAKRYREKNEDVFRNRDNLYKKVKRFSMKVMMDPVKNAERLKKQRVAKAACRKRKREEMEDSISQSRSTSTTESSQY